MLVVSGRKTNEIDTFASFYRAVVNKSSSNTTQAAGMRRRTRSRSSRCAGATNVFDNGVLSSLN
jgi:hypothetical protein